MKDPTKEGNFYFKIRSFLDAIKEGGEAPVSTSEIIYNQAILDGINKSHALNKEIDIVIISKLFAISIARDFKVEGIVPYSDVDTIEELCEICECNIDDFHVILGADWYLTYIDRQDNLEIMEWVSLANPKDKMRQT